MGEKPKKLLLAQELLEQGEFKEALRIIDKLDKASNLNDEEKLSYYLLKGSILFDLSQFEQSYKIAEQAYQESRGVKGGFYEIDILILIARNLIRLNKLDDALDILKQAEDLIRNYLQESSSTTNLKQRKATLFSLKASTYFFKGDSENALPNTEESLSLSNEIGDKKGIMVSLIQLGLIYFMYKGDWEKSLNYSEQAKELGEEIGIQKCRFKFAQNYVNLGNNYSGRGELDRALPYYE